MKKLSCLFLVCLAILLMTIEVKADSSFEVVGGVEYLRLDYTPLVNGKEQSWPKETQKVIDYLGEGYGFYLGGVYYLDNKQGFELIGSFLESDYQGEIDGAEIEKINNLIGVHGRYKYLVNDYLALKGGFSYYRFKEEESEVEGDFDEVVEKGSGFGPSAGLELNIPLGSSFSIKGSLNYSLLEINIDKAYDYKEDELVESDYNRSYRMNPLTLGLGVNYSF